MSFPVFHYISIQFTVSGMVVKMFIKLFCIYSVYETDLKDQ